MSNALNEISKLKQSPLYSLLMAMYERILAKNNANEEYVRLKIMIDGLLMKGYRFNSNEIQAAVSMLNDLPAYGANQLNFEKLYLRDEYTLRKLPKDPRDIPKGHWH
ncbi:hypothetical protein BCT63_01830 [Vibrio kanaloae]|uniref:hypothetical protein n=1 Tax=Vibrio kanaloae TaxID=170673 RepID=UPI000C830670|nr:hypothetical protein [Vibrio kanaloae]PMM03108.1 hypothetical protein BCT63_01830 [Vibrio kanaloae]